tara:strand:- start:1750 stop:2526 length:777 start_codon:yes stop_codon:yes gene_type:complete
MGRYGTKRLGLITPSGNTTMEDDFHRWMPPDVKLHVARISGDLLSDAEKLTLSDESIELESLQAMGNSLHIPAKDLSDATVDVIGFGCTGASFLNGPGYDNDISDRIETASGGIKAVVAAKAVVDSLNYLGVENIAICSPYTDVLNQRLLSYYSLSGFNVVNFASNTQLDMTYDSYDSAIEMVVKLALDVNCEEADAIFISCTAFEGAAEAIENLEATTGKPVITSNQAVLWRCMKIMDINIEIPGTGSLFTDVSHKG